jgi:hypothetical protein
MSKSNNKKSKGQKQNKAKNAGNIKLTKTGGALPRLTECPREKERCVGCAICACNVICGAPGKDNNTPPSTPQIINLCDECAFEFGACQGAPVFASDKDASLKGAAVDAVIECAVFIAAQSLPAFDELAKPSTPPVETNTPQEINTEAESIHDISKYIKTGDGMQTEETGIMEVVHDPFERFKREEDFGKCPSCGELLKRTAMNSSRDAVRCSNHGCRQYREVIRLIPAE